jgi:hypothetical protein
MRLSQSDLELLDEIEPILCDSPAWKAKVLAVVGSKPSGLPPESQPVVERVLDFAHDVLRANWVVAEPYTSTDWADEYQAWYSRIFRKIPRSATRLHFLRINRRPPFRLTKLRLKAGLFNLGALVDRGDVSYLGYSVLRPFNIHLDTPDPKGFAKAPTVGETVLAFPRLERRLPDSEDPDAEHTQSFPRDPPPSCCHSEFKSHLLAHELRVDGVPFIQQDQTVSVCAESDMWMVARLLHQRGEGRRYRPSDMERSARETYTIGPAREGLDSYQIVGALQELGLNPDCIVPGNAADGLSLIAAYTASGLPVIASVVSQLHGEPNPNHVITILGVDYGRKLKDWARIKGNAGFRDGLFTAGSFAKSVVAHNDSRGPYEVLRVSSLPRQGKDVNERLVLGDYIVFEFFVPLPQRVHMRVDDIRLHVNQWLGYNLLRSENLPGLSERWDKSELENLVLRGYLIEGHRLKREALRVAYRALPNRQPPDGWGLEYYWRQRWPKHVWVVELSPRKRTRLDLLPDHRITGEMIFDATAHYSDFANSLLSFRLNGRMLYRDHRDRVPGAKRVVPWQLNGEDLRAWKQVKGLYAGEYLPFVE